MAASNDPNKRGKRTDDEDRTLVITYDAKGRSHRRFEHIDGIRERLSKVASAPSRAPGGPKAKAKK